MLVINTLHVTIEHIEYHSMYK